MGESLTSLCAVQNIDILILHLVIIPPVIPGHSQYR